MGSPRGLIREFLRYIKTARRLSPRTVFIYARSLNEFSLYLHVQPNDFDPSIATTEDIRDWLVSLSEKGLSNATINNMLSALRAMYHYAEKRGLLQNNPMSKVISLKTPSRLPTYIPESRMENLAGRVMHYDENSFEEVRNALIILMFYCTGIRLAELVGVDIINFTGNFETLTVRGKGDKERMMPIVDSLQERIHEYLKIRREICSLSEKALFLSLRGGMIGKRITRSEVYYIVNQTLGELGITGKRSPHVLRHTFATHLLNSGADIREIQSLLGHTSLAATQVYTHNDIARLQNIYKTAHPRAGKKKLRIRN